MGIMVTENMDRCQVVYPNGKGSITYKQYLNILFKNIRNILTRKEQLFLDSPCRQFFQAQDALKKEANDIHTMKRGSHIQYKKKRNQENKTKGASNFKERKTQETILTSGRHHISF